MDRTFIETDDRHSAFYQRLRRELRTAGIEVVDTPADATATLRIHADITDQRVLAVSARNVPREFEVYYTVSYSVQSGENTLIETRTLTKTRAYTWDETQVLGKSQEELELRNALVGDLVRVVLIQLSSL
jgi:LPS-assembly lipoprotein